MLKETTIHTHFPGIKSLEKRHQKPATLLPNGRGGVSGWLKNRDGLEGKSTFPGYSFVPFGFYTEYKHYHLIMCLFF